MKRVLFVSYTFPPIGGAGVQRTTKFVKYLPQFGWEATVLTVANPSVPALDPSLCDDIPVGTAVRRAETWEPSYSLKSIVSASNGTSATIGGVKAGLTRRLKKVVRGISNAFLQPDAQILWFPGAVREGCRALRETPHDAIIATGPPFSSFLVGATLARRSGLPLVLDYRDEWTISNAYQENRRMGPVSRVIQGRLQRKVVRAAAAILATTKASALAVDEIRTVSGAKARVGWIYNGYDPDDFPSAPPVVSGDRFRLAYVGTLWELTSVAPIIEAVRLLARQASDVASRLELVFAGRRTNAQAQLLQQLRGQPVTVVEYPYLEHKEALELMQTSHALLALLSDLPAAERVVPAKIFEYMACRRPILGVAPKGELWDVMADYRAGTCIAPSDVEGIARWLTDHARGKVLPTSTNSICHTRPAQASQLAAVLDAVSRSSHSIQEQAMLAET